MTALLTNTAAMIALNTLRGIEKGISVTQDRISSGKRVANASDNAAYWSIATTMRSDKGALSAVKDALGLGAATVDVAFKAMDTTVKVVSEMEQKLTTSTDGSIDKDKIQSDLNELQGQLSTIASSANFSGENWLEQNAELDDLNKQITGSFTRNADGSVHIESIQVDSSKLVLVDTQDNPDKNIGLVTSSLEGDADTAWLNYKPGSSPVEADPLAVPVIVAAPAVEPEMQLVVPEDKADGYKIRAYEKALKDTIAEYAPDYDKVVLSEIVDRVDQSLLKLGGKAIIDLDISRLEKSVEDKAVLKAVISTVDKQMGKITDAATHLGSAKKRINMQKEFVSDLSDAITRGVSQMVDADMNIESTRLKALQSQQQLGIKALSIANASTNTLLSLFK
ncbi:flagellin [Polycladidibacter stylochi]|uniref:flagellin N-terminal helical domain-containing protein n=1 Tax=Polycladidibacter stylochi TaxID=1807766 RepID=UPI00082AB32E|nr:flagellin [Pseudovibrio stylochi]